MKQLIVSLLLCCLWVVSCSSPKETVAPGTTSENSDVSTNKHSNQPSVVAEAPKNELTTGNDASNETVNLAPSWHGDWEDFSVKTSGDFVKDKVRYKWIGGRTRLPKKAGCWAFYDGVTSKADWVESFKHSKWDGELEEFAKESKRNLAQLSNERFKQVTLVCTEKNGEEIPIGADCIHSGYFYDNGSIYEPITCQIGLDFEIELLKIMRK